MSGLKLPGKSFEVSKLEVWEAYRKVRANQGAPGVDEVSLAEFEKDLKGSLYKIWNRMSSGSYFPPLVRAVEIPKDRGKGVRVLGVPTVADRVAQTVVAGLLGERGWNCTRTAHRAWERAVASRPRFFAHWAWIPSVPRVW